MTQYQWMVLEQGLPGLAVAAICCIASWSLSAGRPGSTRTLVSAHGALFALALGYAIVIAPQSATQQNSYLVPFFTILGTGVLSAVAAAVLASGRTLLRLLVVYASLASGAWIWLVGSMAITHDWL